MQEERGRNVVLVLVGVAALVACRHLPDPLAGFARAHGANVSVSFAVFFLARLMRLPGQRRAATSAAYALAVVWAAELAQLLGLYPGVFDPLDLAFDALGVATAWAVHHLLVRRSA